MDLRLCLQSLVAMGLVTEDFLAQFPDDRAFLRYLGHLFDSGNFQPAEYGFEFVDFIQVLLCFYVHGHISFDFLVRLLYFLSRDTVTGTVIQPLFLCSIVIVVFPRDCDLHRMSDFISVVRIEGYSCINGNIAVCLFSPMPTDLVDALFNSDVGDVFISGWVRHELVIFDVVCCNELVVLLFSFLRPGFLLFFRIDQESDATRLFFTTNDSMLHRHFDCSHYVDSRHLVFDHHTSVIHYCRVRCVYEVCDHDFCLPGV